MSSGDITNYHNNFFILSPQHNSKYQVMEISYTYSLNCSFCKCYLLTVICITASWHPTPNIFGTRHLPGCLLTFHLRSHHRLATVPRSIVHQLNCTCRRRVHEPTVQHTIKIGVLYCTTGYLQVLGCTVQDFLGNTSFCMRCSRLLYSTFPPAIGRHVAS